MELDFERYCVIDDESPNTVLLLPEPNRVSSNRRKNLQQEFKDINFNRFRSFSCKTVANRASGLDRNELLKRGSVSVYRSSKEVKCEERKKIEVSRKSDAPFSFKILDSFCSSDEDEEQRKTMKNRGGSIGCCSDDLLEFSLDDFPAHSGTNSSRPSLMMKKMMNPFVKSKSHKIQRNSITRNSKSFEKPRKEICSSAHLHGLLKVRIRKGLPSFEFSVNSIGEDGVLVARKWKAEKKNTTGGWVFEDYSKKPSVITGQMQVSCKDNVATEFVLYENSSCSEIAAIVIETSFQTDSNLQPTINIVIPAGYHTLPSNENLGPSPLLDRWRLNGGCECGGWDMACRLTVLTNSTVHNCRKDRLQIDQLRPRPRPIQLFFQGGGKEKEPGLSMKPIDGGLFSIDFQTRLSMLQAFSICISILHCTDKRLLQSDSMRVQPSFSPIDRV